MSKIANAFKNGTAFIGFLTAGDPTIDKTVEFILAMEEAGCDLIEIGIPFSDPMAEGVVIQDANVRALKHNTTTDDVFDIVIDENEIPQPDVEVPAGTDTKTDNHIFSTVKIKKNGGLNVPEQGTFTMSVTFVQD